MDNVKWLIENGGPAIRLKMLNEALISKNTFDENDLVRELLQIEKVKAALSYFDQFKNLTFYSFRELGCLVHNCYENCFEMFMPFLIRLGFRSGIEVLDEKSEIMRFLYSHLLKNNDPFAGNIVMMLLAKAGYYFDDMIPYIKKRLNAVHRVALLKEYDIYETDPDKIRRPKQWADKLILKDKYNPYEDELPLPIIYDIELFIYVYNKLDNADKQKVDCILDYVTDYRYTKLNGDYGWHWSESAKTYHASSPGFGLPKYDFDNMTSGHLYFFFSTLEKLSYSPAICDNDIIIKCIDFIEKHKTEQGTYMLPESYMHAIFTRPANTETIYKAFISDEKLASIKANKRKTLAFEIYTTYFVEMLKNRIRRKTQCAI